MSEPNEERIQPLSPETASIHLGHGPEDSLGSLKPPIYETSTFVFETAEEGKRFFELTYGLDEPGPGESSGFIYTRLDNPNLRLVEEKMTALDATDDSLVFATGMAGISTVLLTYLRPGDLVLYSAPLYGGTSTLFHGLLTDLGIESVPFGPDARRPDLDRMIEQSGHRLRMIWVETPSNPTVDMFDIEMAAAVCSEHATAEPPVRLVVDNTFLSPVWQTPIRLGADLVVHSATKYLGGHSDLTAGVVSGAASDIETLRRMRYRLGTTLSPHTAWLLSRSLETLELRVLRQTESATAIAAFLADHPKVAAVRHLSLLAEDSRQHDLYQRQCRGPGAMISFEVTGGEQEAFRFLDAMRLVRLTVSLGGTETLAQHPFSMTHSTVDAGTKTAQGITEGMIRLSVGIENVDDLISDLDKALEVV